MSALDDRSPRRDDGYQREHGWKHLGHIWRREAGHDLADALAESFGDGQERWAQFRALAQRLGELDVAYARGEIEYDAHLARHTDLLHALWQKANEGAKEREQARGRRDMLSYSAKLVCDHLINSN